MTFPDRRFTRAILARAFLIWLAIRTALVFLGMLPRAAGAAEALSPVAVLWLIAVCTVLTLFDLRRTGEELFLANLGVRVRTLTLLAVGPALMLELLVDVVVL
ncbi:MAG: hypothetical protein OEO20_14710 [Gemmatimonadota bacterium]|nr:hypothetical protein [Gemmatimonadota bacterium]MDH3367280.1 hypothetical protein [Gemmatimonadota bacterium]MDH3479545.1 hypothetical protein [Gemmatimonadota bacterium]MDH3568723.1 hypothetical protein [Gemmatimonadota bacterium]MDH5549724.1 hypothetical protein [Gemmatimonadota bacterium]